MSFLEAIQTCFSKYAAFSGRALRSEFWFFTLFMVIAAVIASLIDALLFGVPDGAGFVSLVVALALLLPNLAVSVRRLHDIGKSGWFLLLGLIPLAGIIILLIWFCRKGDEGPNAYGPPQLVRP